MGMHDLLDEMLANGESLFPKHEKENSMKTLEMLFKAEHDGNTYKSVDMCYSKEKGFYDCTNGSDWKWRCELNELIHDDGSASDGWELVDTTISFQEMCELAFSGRHTLFEDLEGDRLVYTSVSDGGRSFFWGGDYKYPLLINKEVVSDKYKKIYR